MRRRDNLNRAEILESALRLVDDQGMEALSMRRLADAMGVSPMGLYRHVKTRDEILDGLADKALEALNLEPDPDADWEMQLKQIFTSVHETLLEHPGLISILNDRPVSAERALEAVERILAIVRTAGFSGEEAISILAALQSYTFGFSVQQRARAGRDHHQHAERLQSLPATRFPNVLELAVDFAAWTSEDHFHYGLDRLFDGIRHHN